eukprot:TRINITY_DN5268_c0_g2_i1.p1 TRINITY_DN5268_c0_g2~~TRINITY_DN5268_c0_g2_i1.p1  ORF type:complete len:285 (-),score=20.60 TRINITY_DN5268_c0_g2_i1:23-877(-)
MQRNLVLFSLVIISIITLYVGIRTNVQRQDEQVVQHDCFLHVPSSYSKPHVCFVVRTYQGHGSRILALVASILGNSSSSASFHFLDTSVQGDFHTLKNITDLINAIYGREIALVGNITFAHALKNYPALAEFIDSGYVITDMYMRQTILHNESDCDYVVVTNGDNLYSSNFLPTLRPYMLNRTEIIGVEFISHYTYNEEHSFTARIGSDFHFFTEFAYIRVDLGAVAFQVEKWKQLNLTFLTALLEKDKNMGIAYSLVADGVLIPAFADQSTRHIVPRVLFVHQ